MVDSGSRSRVILLVLSSLLLAAGCRTTVIVVVAQPGGGAAQTCVYHENWMSEERKLAAGRRNGGDLDGTWKFTISRIEEAKGLDGCGNPLPPPQVVELQFLQVSAGAGVAYYRITGTGFPTITAKYSGGRVTLDPYIQQVTGGWSECQGVLMVQETGIGMARLRTGPAGIRCTFTPTQ